MSHIIFYYKIQVEPFCRHNIAYRAMSVFLNLSFQHLRYVSSDNCEYAVIYVHFKYYKDYLVRSWQNVI